MFSKVDTNRLCARSSSLARSTSLRLAGIAAAAACLVMVSPSGEAEAGWSIHSRVSESYGPTVRRKPSKLGGPSSGYAPKAGSLTKAKAKRKAKKAYSKKKSNKKIGWKGGSKSFKNKPKTAKKPVKLANLGKTFDVNPTEATKKSLSGGSVRWVASAGCLNGRLKAVVNEVAANFGPVTVNSTCRSKKHNRRVGGAKRSKHLTGDAVDFRVHSNYRAAYAYLKQASGVGGYKHYGGGLFHIDTGPRRTW